MIRALYSASSGMVAQSARQDVTANNIANAQTHGFKRMRAVTSSFAQALESRAAALADRPTRPYPDTQVSTVTAGAEEAQDLRQGTIRQTGNKLEFAIEGPGAFEVVSDGAAKLTRNGCFHIDKDGELSTSDGAKVMGQSGPIKLPKAECEVLADGSVVSGGSQLGKIKITGAVDKETRVLQGYLEESNVNIVTEMVEMIANMRAFEANQKVVTSVDQTLDKLISEAGRV